MMKAANRKEFDVLMAWSIDRLGRSLIHLLQIRAMELCVLPHRHWEIIGLRSFNYFKRVN